MIQIPKLIMVSNDPIEEEKENYNQERKKTKFKR
jgi:hypothetical protein